MYFIFYWYDHRRWLDLEISSACELSTFLFYIYKSLLPLSSLNTAKSKNISVEILKHIAIIPHWTFWDYHLTVEWRLLITFFLLKPKKKRIIKSFLPLQIWAGVLKVNFISVTISYWSSSKNVIFFIIIFI